MKNILLAGVIAIHLCACGNGPTEVTFNKLDNYFLSNTVEVPEGINVFTAQDDSTFYQLAGIAKTMSNEIRKPDFEHETVIIVAGQPTNHATQIDVEKVTVTETDIIVHITIEKGEELSYTMKPTTLFTLPKQANDKVVSIMEGAAAVAVGTVK